MLDEKNQVLTIAQATTAICLDFQMYPPQTMLFCEVVRSILEDDAAVMRKPGYEGVWVRYGKQGKMRWIEGRRLAEHVAHLVETVPLTPEKVTALCSRVFQTSARLVHDPCRRRTLIRIPTSMRDFACRQCGNCCRSLAYQDALTQEDVTRWQSQGRDDILRWVGKSRTLDPHPAYRIWVIPGTNRFAQVCPFLQAGPSQAQRRCAIQETKPGICRQYPLSRKHGLMTGCRGFER